MTPTKSKTSNISKWSLFVTDKDYTEEQLRAAIHSRGLIPAHSHQLKEYISTGWDWNTVVTCLDGYIEEDAQPYLVGLVRPLIWNKILTKAPKPDIFKKHHWKFLLSNPSWE